MSENWTGRETSAVSLPGPGGGLAAEQMQGPLHAVAAGLEDLTKTTSLCNRTVRVWGERPFDTTDDDACPVCVERAQETGSPR